MPNKLEPDGVDGETGSPREPKASTMWAEMDPREAREKPGEQELLECPQCQQEEDFGGARQVQAVARDFAGARECLRALHLDDE